MRVFLAGATGVAGRPTVRALVAAGHQVTGVARSGSRAELLRSLGASPIEVDLFSPTHVRDAVRGHAAIVNLVTKIPGAMRTWVPGAWKENDRIRTQVSRNLVDAGLAEGAEHYVQESLAFMYPDRGDRWIDEEVPPTPPRYAHSVLDAEDQARRFVDGGGSGVVLRFGQFYAPDASHTVSMIAIARRGISPFVGPKDAFLPLVYADDVGRAVVMAVAAPSGIYNVVDDEPLRQRDLAEALATALGRGRLRFPPRVLMRLGGSKVEMLMRSQRVSNRRFRDATGWQPGMATAREGFLATVEGGLGTA